MTAAALPLVGLLAAGAEALDARVGTMQTVILAPAGAPVDERIPVMLVDARRLGVATDARAGTPVADDDVAGDGKDRATPRQRLEQGAALARLRALVKGGATRISVVVDASARADQVEAALAAAESAGLRPQLVDAHERPWRRAFHVGIPPCRDPALPECMADPDRCEPTLCGELHVALLPGGATVSLRRRFTDADGTCLERPSDAAPTTPAAWDGVPLRSAAGRCPALAEFSAGTLETLQAELTPHIAPCTAATLLLPPAESAARTGAALGVLAERGITVVTLQTGPAPNCDAAVPLSALDTAPAELELEVLKAAGGRRAPAVLAVLRSQRAPLSECLARTRLAAPGTALDARVVLRIAGTGTVASLKWDTPPPEALRTCLEGHLRGAAYDRAARPSEVTVRLRAAD